MENYYIVKKGDSLWAIASKYGTSVDELKTVNNLKSYNLSIGQLLKLPSKNNENNDVNTDEVIYTVQKGDSLWAIASKYNVSVDDIKKANNLSSNLLSIGQKLTIPVIPNMNQITYTVKKGDSLWSIANANNTTVDELANLNDLATNTIYVGQVLQIPNTGNSGVEMPDMDTVYIVQKGDTVYSIALKYNTTPAAIMNKNNLTSNILSVGQTLTIPGDVESTGDDDDVINTNTYIVQRGDSLYSISTAYGVSVDDLKRANNLTTDVLTIGQLLIIPTNTDSSNGSTTSNLYVVQKGDSLWSIANRFGVSINAIRMMNNLNSDILSIGQTLIIP